MENREYMKRGVGGEKDAGMNGGTSGQRNGLRWAKKSMNG
jgi:hypothetical protein